MKWSFFNFLSLLVFFTIFAMDDVTNTTKEHEELNLEKLPLELQQIILTFLISDGKNIENLKTGIKDLKNVEKTNKYFKQLINNTTFTNNLINIISEKFRLHPIESALYLKTPGSINWINNFLNQLEEMSESDKQKVEETLKKILLNATKKNDINLVQFLLEKGANPNIGFSEIYNPEMIGTETKEQSLLIRAAQKGQKDLVDLLVANKAKINETDRMNRTALIWAALGKYLEIAKFLINSGADTEIKDQHGRTALFYAVIKNQPELVKILIDAKADVNIQDENDETPLQAAIRNNSAQTITLLENAGARS